jgi:hypothetical protein
MMLLRLSISLQLAVLIYYCVATCCRNYPGSMFNANRHDVTHSAFRTFCLQRTAIVQSQPNAGREKISKWPCKSGAAAPYHIIVVHSVAPKVRLEAYCVASGWR